MNKHKTSLFDVTGSVIYEAEQKALKIPLYGNIQNGYLRMILSPFVFIRIGMMDLFSALVLWSALTIVLTGFFFLLGGFLTQVDGPIFLACAGVVFLWVTFAVPSFYSFDSIKSKEIQSLADYIHFIGIENGQKIEALENNISMIAERANLRTKALQWSVAAVWAIIMFVINQTINIALVLKPGLIEEIIYKTLNDIATLVTVAAFVGAHVLIMSLKKSNDAVFRRIQLAIQELKYRLAAHYPDVV